MFNIRASHLESDLVDVHAAFGDAIKGLTFEFEDLRGGSIQAVGGGLGRSGMTISSHRVTTCNATLPASRQLRFEKSRRGTVVQRYGDTNLVSSGGSSFLTGPGVSEISFLEIDGPVESMSVNLPVDTLDRYLILSEEPLAICANFIALDASGSAADGALSELMAYILRNLELYSNNPRLLELADALLLETYLSFLRNVGYLQLQEHAGVRKNTRRHDGSARLVVHAEAFIRAKCSTPLTVADIATAVGVSIRKLQTAFVNHRSLSPGQYLAKVRLEKAHHLLSNPHDTSVNVTSVAYDCGIMHLGRFSRAYLYTYGEYPSQTLANARRKH